MYFKAKNNSPDPVPLKSMDRVDQMLVDSEFQTPLENFVKNFFLIFLENYT